MSSNNFGRSITKIAFRFRLTDEEFLNLLDAAAVDRGVRAWVETFKLANEIDLGAERTVSALRRLSDAGLIAPSRVNEILGAQIQPEERP